MKSTFLFILLLDIASAQSSCSASCKGTTSDGIQFDLSALMGQDYQTVGSDQNADTYFLNVCGVSKTQCPDDAGDPPVTKGMAVQTVQSGGCYVMGQYTGDNCLWTANPGGQQGIQLVLDNGSNNLCGDGSPRQITVAFVCPAAGPSGKLVPESWTGVNLPGSCEYTYTFETCAACSGGCGPPPSLPCTLPTNFTANSNKGTCPGPNGTLASDHFCTIECDPTYLASGSGVITCHNGTITAATLTCEPPKPICCQAQPSFPKYKELCIGISNKTTCLDPTTGYGKTCEWTCGECDANTNESQYQKYCLQHDDIGSCNALNTTCHWTTSDVARSRAQNKMTLLERLVAFVERTFVVDE